MSFYSEWVLDATDESSPVHQSSFEIPLQQHYACCRFQGKHVSSKVYAKYEHNACKHNTRGSDNKGGAVLAMTS